MQPLQLTSIHIPCEPALADEFKRVVEQQGHSMAIVLQELMQDYIKQANNPLVVTDQEKIKTVLKQDAATRMTPLTDKAADDLLQLAIGMAEKHI